MFYYHYAAPTLILVGVFLTFGLDMVDRIERSECIKWREEAQEFPNYYITKWQSDQCIYQGVNIHAPVK